MISKSRAEHFRLNDSESKNWKKWGPYVSERQWGTVREDYSHHGDAWGYVSHDMARSYAYRWGEDGIAGFCDNKQILCMAPAFWNGEDSIIKERLYGLTNGQGNHGEDVKEIYFHLDSSPTHSYCKFLYKYPQTAFPYTELQNFNQRSRLEPEYEIIESGVFDEGNYWDCYVEYAKASEDDILQKITVVNRSKEEKTIHILPHIWFRNYWNHNLRYEKPVLAAKGTNCIKTKSVRNGKYHFYHEEGTQLFCENETNNHRFHNFPNSSTYVKDAINNYIVDDIGNPSELKEGTKAAVHIVLTVAPGASASCKIRLSKKGLENPWENFDQIFYEREEESKQYYNELLPKGLHPFNQDVFKKALSGLLWTKSFYYYDVYKWLYGGPGEIPPQRLDKRNNHWQHLTNRHIISMPDKWEYPWYAAWDLAFHATSFAIVDPHYAKNQLLRMLSEGYIHPNGQIPAYEWNFSDVNPPVHSWAVWSVYEKDKKTTGTGDYVFLEKAFQRLLINFTWWVNQKDSEGTNLFEGGFLGLDNIGVFDRNQMPAGIKNMQQADATSWMAKFSIEMLRMAMELAEQNPNYEDIASKFFRHFLNIGWAMHNIGEKDISLWDDQDAFYYDVVKLKNGDSARLKVRSLVGIIPLFAVEVIPKTMIDSLKRFKKSATYITNTRPDLASLISRIEEKNENGEYLFSIMRAYRLEHVLKKLLDKNEFLSDYGIRSLSKYHKKHPFVFQQNGKHTIHYEPGESSTSMFGGNSNWRGPIWFPLNYLIIQSLRKYYRFYGDEYVYEFPTGSKKKLNLNQIANELTKRLLKLFKRDQTGKYRYHTSDDKQLFALDEHFKDHHLFYEFFHGDNGRGLGASHQTGWTALIANLILEMEEN